MQNLSKLHKYISSLTKKDKVLVMGHSIADVDSVSSAASLASYIKKVSRVSCDLGFPDHVNPNATKLAEELDICYVINPKLEDYDKIFVVDFSAFEMLGEVEDSFYKAVESGTEFVCIDHHEGNKDFLKKMKLSFVENSASATCVLVYSLFNQNNVKLDKTTATLIAAGIFVDSAGMKVANPDALEIVAACLRVAKTDLPSIRLLISIKNDISKRLAKIKASKRVKIYGIGDFLICVSHVNCFESDSAQALMMLGSDVSIVYSKEKEGRIILRLSDSGLHDYNLNLATQMIPYAIEKHGCRGGGHPGAAGIHCKVKDVNKIVDSLIESVRLNLPEGFKRKRIKEYWLFLFVFTLYIVVTYYEGHRHFYWWN